MLRTVATALLTGFLCLGGAAAAFANTTPNQPGQPNQSCQSFSSTTRPGNSYLSPGSVFNEPNNVNSANGGTGGNAYNNAGPDHLGAPSQYDVACYQQSVH